MGAVVKALLPRRRRGWKKWVLAARKRVGQLRNVCTLLQVVGAFLLRERWDRSRWEKRLRRGG